ncbi:hypothetical protein VPH35_106146 [Triticum aestivum]|uniref:uncharacterized protein n=1 Tax=Triticum aestivum TaxID=4565 RepID=UPI001D031AD0|nr:uncharacterized protein LOC123131033 [Triticum aestivum]
MPKETRLPKINQYGVQWLYTGGDGSQRYGGQWPYTGGEGSQCYDTAQESTNHTWHDEDTQRGLNTDILIASHDRGNTVPRIITDYFHENVIGLSYIPPESQSNTYNFASGSQYGLQTPAPMQESRTQEDEGSTAVVFMHTDHLIPCRLSVVRKDQLAVVE